MKKYFFILVFTLGLFSSCAQDETTTYYLIRHSEKDRTDKTNPNLNNEGKKRAQNWADYFEDIDLDAVYATNYNRTQQTATPTAESKDLEIINYNPSKMYDAGFQEETKGKTVLIVGHSNTTPAFVNKILGEKKYSDIDDSVNSMLFIVTINGETKSSEMINVD